MNSKTPIADEIVRRRYGLPPDFDLDSAPMAHWEDIGYQYQASLEKKRKTDLARQAELDALKPPAILPKFVKTASYLKGDRRIVGIASTGAINQHGYALHPGGCRLVLPVPLLLSHDFEKCVGSVEGVEITSDGKVKVWANLDHRCDTQTWEKIQSGELGCFSGAFDQTKGTFARPVIIDGIKNYHDWRLKEVSLCPVGANHECVVTEVWPPIDEDETPAKASALEKRIAALESKPMTIYRGTWSDSVEYIADETVTDKGSMWICQVGVTKCRPGTNGDWKLVVKRGEA